MKLNDEYNRLLVILVALSIMVSALIMVNKNDSKKETNYEIPEDILDSYYYPSRLSIIMQKYLTDEEITYIKDYKVVPEETLIKIKECINKENNNIKLVRKP